MPIFPGNKLAPFWLPGKIIFEKIAEPAELLISLLRGISPNHFQVFIDNNILWNYNTAFQITAFGATENRHGHFMPKHSKF